MSHRRPLVLGIETSCDDTGCALVDGEGRVVASVVSSQLAAHRPYGGVVPEIASREHLAAWPAVSAAAFERAGISGPAEVDAIAVTRGPGLVGCLLVGLSIGRAAALALGRSFHAVHHLEGHLFSPFLRDDGLPAQQPSEGFTGLVVSGGHSSLLEVEGGEVRSLVETRDDALGEVFDKVGKRLGLAYPQGPEVDRLAELGRPDRYPLPIPRGRGQPFFSFSGLKSQALREIQALEAAGILAPAPAVPGDDGDGQDLPPEALDLLAGFRLAAVRQIIDRLESLHAERPLGLLAVSGGAAANRLLRRQLPEWSEARGVDLRLVPLPFAGDNAAMIAFAGLLREGRGQADDPRDIEAVSRLPFERR